MTMALNLKSLHIFLLFSLILFISTLCPYANSSEFSNKTLNLTRLNPKPINGSVKLKHKVVIQGRATISSENNTFKLGFFAPNVNYRWYLGIWYASIPVSTNVWVANRESPVKNLQSASAEITENGRLAVMDQESRTILWETNNLKKGSHLKLLEQGNLVLLSTDGSVVWQSIDSPSDTCLPGLNMTATRRVVSWKSSVDPSPGRYSMSVHTPDYGEIALYYSYKSGPLPYWNSGKWTGSAFEGVPEMTVPYIYKFEFLHPFTPMASFAMLELPLENGVKPPLTRFMLDHTGQTKQFTWSPESGGWTTFWSQPRDVCKVYGLCGNLGLCNGDPLSPCQCLDGFSPVNNDSWANGDFSEGCRRKGGKACNESDVFEEIGVVSHEKMKVVSFSGNREKCEGDCLKSCSCIGLYHNMKSNLCRNLYGPLLNLRNATSGDKLYLRVQTTIGSRKMSKNSKENVFLVGAICFGILVLSMGSVMLVYMKRTRVQSEKGEDCDDKNLRVFSYKELQTATKGFSVKLGQGGFGAVFQGVLTDSSVVAVKRLDRGGGEKEFRAEVCTIGSIQHVNLVRLRGFCSESSHRLLVYECMANGALGGYLRPDGPNLSWDVRFRAAVGTARGIAYLHEECCSCIIHCDIKPENILLDEDFSPKVSDFGLAKLMGRDFSRVAATVRGTWGYMAPEWISGVAITAKADVYSFGMTLLELIGGRRNVEGGPPSSGEGAENWLFPPWAAQRIVEGEIGAVVDGRLEGLYDGAEAVRLGMVAVWCIQDEEEARPAMGMVVKMMEGVVEVAVPPLPNLMQALVSGDSFRGVVVGEEYDDVRVSNGSESSAVTTKFGHSSV